MMQRRYLPLIILLVMFIRCSPVENSLVGEWSGNHPHSGENTLRFNADGTAVWQFDNPHMSQSHLRYVVDYSVTPHTIILSDFDHGPLMGLSMYGIFEFPCPNRLRLDLEPGGPDTDPKTVRPETFTEDTLEYRRKMKPSEKPSHRKEGETG